MPGLVDCGVVLRTALPSGNTFFTSFDQSLQGTVCYIQPIEPEFLLLTVMYMKLQFSVRTHPRC